MKQKPLFPAMETAIREDRTAANREQVQLARARLKGRDLGWLINYLLDNGPQTEHVLILELPDGKGDHPAMRASRMCCVLCDLLDLWRVRKLWRQSVGIHHGSGQESFIYGIRGVHPVPNK